MQQYDEEHLKRSLLDESIKYKCLNKQIENRFSSWCDTILHKNRKYNKESKCTQLKKPCLKTKKISFKYDYENYKCYMNDYRKSKGYYTPQEKTRFEGIRLVSAEEPKVKLPEIDLSSLRKKLARISKSDLGYHKSISTSKSTIPSIATHNSSIMNTIQFKNGFLTDTLSQKKILMIYKGKQDILSNKIFKIEDKLSQFKEIQTLSKNAGNQSRQSLHRSSTDLKLEFKNFKLR
jgi:hypothetical protein